MRKAFLVSALALGIAGCASTPNNAPVVRDLSASRSTQSSGDTVTVQSGDTLYGIAWRQNMDFRELAQLNGISPPYRLQPGQTLRLSDNASATASSAVNSQNTTVASSTDPVDAGSADWLAPDAEAIERNRRLTSRPIDSSSPTQSAPASQPSTEALAAAGQAGGEEGPGPVFNYGSPGADGALSNRDQAERDALARQRAAREAEANTQPTTTVSSASTAGTTNTGQASNSAAATSQSSSGGNSNAGAEEPASSSTADAGTAVAGGASAPAPQQRTFQPVENIPWQWPVDGQLIGRFGDGSNITAGIDIAGQKGQPVKAAGPGIVVYAGNGVRGYGNLILLKHNDRYLSAYAHNDSLRVKENDVVEAGEVIATMGDTDAQSVKLHFEVRQDGQPQDPLKFLPQR